jgi:hypothetical protein
MPWIWTNPSEDVVPVWADYNHKLSTFNSSWVLDGVLWPLGSGTAVFRVRRFKTDRVKALKCLPTTGSAPVVAPEMANVINGITGLGEVQFYPVQIVCHDGVVEGYSFVIPLHRYVCVEIEKSDITDWMVPGVSALEYRSLVLKPDCLGSLNIARDDVTSRIVVSDAFREALLQTKDKGLAFIRPEEAKRPYW